MLRILVVVTVCVFLSECQHCPGKICLTQDYQAWRYQDSQDRQFTVHLEIKIFDVGKVDTDSNSLTLDLALKLYWVDNRVSCRDREQFCLVVDKQIMDMVWKPTLYIEKLKNFKLKKCQNTVEDMGVDMTGNVTKLFHYSEAEVTVSCPMSFTWYPFDQQLCRFNMFELNLEPVEKFQLLLHRNTDFGSYYQDTFQPANTDYQFTIEDAGVRNFSYSNFDIEGMQNR